MPAGVERIVGFMRGTASGFDSLEQARTAIAEYLPQREPRPLEGLRRVLRRTSDGRWRWHWDPALLDSLEVEQISEGDRLQRAARLVKQPTLLVRGGASDVVSEEVARELVASMPRARYVDVSGAGHMVAGDDNDAFSEALLAFACSPLHTPRKLGA